MNTELNEKNIFPTGKRLLIKVAEVQKKTAGGFEISDTATNSAPVYGQVVKAGSESIFKEEDTVMFRRYSIDELKIVGPMGEQLFYFLEDADILATLKVDL